MLIRKLLQRNSVTFKSVDLATRRTERDIRRRAPRATRFPRLNRATTRILSISSSSGNISSELSPLCGFAGGANVTKPIISSKSGEQTREYKRLSAERGFNQNEKRHTDAAAMNE